MLTLYPRTTAERWKAPNVRWPPWHEVWNVTLRSYNQSHNVYGTVRGGSCTFKASKAVVNLQLFASDVACKPDEAPGSSLHLHRA
jgi:hypothetical protein